MLSIKCRDGRIIQTTVATWCGGDAKPFPQFIPASGAAQISVGRDYNTMRGVVNWLRNDATGSFSADCKRSAIVLGFIAETETASTAVPITILVGSWVFHCTPNICNFLPFFAAQSEFHALSKSFTPTPLDRDPELFAAIVDALESSNDVPEEMLEEAAFYGYMPPPPPPTPPPPPSTVELQKSVIELIKASWNDPQYFILNRGYLIDSTPYRNEFFFLLQGNVTKEIHLKIIYNTEHPIAEHSISDPASDILDKIIITEDGMPQNLITCAERLCMCGLEIFNLPSAVTIKKISNEVSIIDIPLGFSGRPGLTRHKLNIEYLFNISCYAALYFEGSVTPIMPLRPLCFIEETALTKGSPGIKLKFTKTALGIIVKSQSVIIPRYEVPFEIISPNILLFNFDKVRHKDEISFDWKGKNRVDIMYFILHSSYN